MGIEGTAGHGEERILSISVRGPPCPRCRSVLGTPV